MPENITVDATAPINIGVLANALFYYRCTDYDDQVKAVLNEASAWVAARAPGVDKPAIVLDIDETSLSNWEQIYHNKFGYVPSGACDLKAQSACGQRDWELSAQATAIGPTLDLFNVAQKLKGKNGEPVDIFFVTGRYEDPFERLATNGICTKSVMTIGAAFSCDPIRAGTTNSCPGTRRCRASRSRLTIRSSPMSAIS
jgi:acid phosphatase